MRIYCELSVWPMWPKMKRNCCWCSIRSSVSNMSATQISQNDNKRHMKKTGSFTFRVSGALFFSPHLKFAEYDSESIETPTRFFFFLSIQYHCIGIHAYVCRSECFFFFGNGMFVCLRVRVYSCGVLLVLLKEPSSPFQMACVWHSALPLPWVSLTIARRTLVQWTIFQSTHTHVLEFNSSKCGSHIFFALEKKHINKWRHSTNWIYETATYSTSLLCCSLGFWGHKSQPIGSIFS